MGLPQKWRNRFSLVDEFFGWIERIPLVKQVFTWAKNNVWKWLSPVLFSALSTMLGWIGGLNVFQFLWLGGWTFALTVATIGSHYRLPWRDP